MIPELPLSDLGMLSATEMAMLAIWEVHTVQELHGRLNLPGGREALLRLLGREPEQLLQLIRCCNATIVQNDLSASTVSA